MMNPVNFNLVVYAWIAIALVMFPLILRVVAPYGRHTTNSWGVLINNRAGWAIMESPSVILFAILFLFGRNHQHFISYVFFALWMVHYINRAFVFPFRTRTRGKQIPVLIVVMAFFFNLMNSFINGYYLGSLSGNYDSGWMFDPRFISGFILFAGGMFLNWDSDNILIHLRKPGETGYIIPQGGLFKYISCPNHFSEIVEWCGFALMTWSLPALAFAIWTFVNLVPRSLHHHKWYKEHFPDYPSSRKAVIPFIL
ncbi:MAG: 3-oxo-5-alpha-steroid 4-dehydrogenase [Bacteroidota bacterium]|nr:3-oxo-5-alpha-steroid 4-dehydrogenase [Bacteroidota bacterium]